jgi:hypothetical protein
MAKEIKTEESVSKWQKASVQITNLRFQLDKILTEGFTQEEKESTKYKQLLETVDILFDHVLGEYREHLEEERQKELEAELEKQKKKSKLFSLRSFLIAIAGVAIAKLIEGLIIAAIAAL